MFTSANAIRQCAACRRGLTTVFSIPEFWWEDYYRKSNGYFGSENTFDNTGSRDGTSEQPNPTVQSTTNPADTWARVVAKTVTSPSPSLTAIQYKWHKLNLFTRHLPSTNQTALIIFDPPPDLQPKLRARLAASIPTSKIYNHLTAYAALLHDFLALQHTAVWCIRNHVRAIETAQSAAPDFRHMHDLARHCIHVCETLFLAQNTVAALLASASATLNPSDASLRSHHTQLQSLLLRADSTKQRLQNEIALAFNSIAQQDARASVTLARAARADGVAVKTIAHVTLAFLPATFVSAIFGTAFFDFEADNGRFVVSNSFWIYWAVTIPVTVLTYVVWFGWEWVAGDGKAVVERRKKVWMGRSDGLLGKGRQGLFER